MKDSVGLVGVLAAGVVAHLAVACNGAGTTIARANSVHDESERGFAQYAATHGIGTLNNPHEVTKVTTDGLRLERVDKSKPVQLDGVLNEWPAPARAMQVVKGDAKIGLTIALQYDDTKLYVGADVTDAAFSPGLDHVSLILAVPLSAGGYAPYEIDFFAGKPGESEGSVRYVQRGPVLGARIMEAQGPEGYTLEAIVPWSALPEARFTRVGIRGVAAYVKAGSAVATGSGDGQHPAAMPWVPTEPELSLIEQELGPRGLSATPPVAELIADLTGDGVRERIAVYEHYLTICGSSYLGGTGYFVRDLVGELVKLDARDVTGRGKTDVLIRRRQSVGDGTREYIEVLSAMNASEAPRVTFAHEIAVRQSDRHIDNAVRISRGEIEVSVEAPSGWDASSYNEPVASEVEPILLPWGRVRQRAYRFDGFRFVRSREVTQREQTTLRPGGGADDETRPAAGPLLPATAKGVDSHDEARELLEQYRKDRGVRREIAPRVDLNVNVAGDARPERVLLIGRDIVVFGPGFKQGTGYAYLTLQPFAEASDIKDLSARDLTGDGAADLVIRGVRHVSDKRDKRDIQIEVMFVYELIGEEITRVFAIETARQQAGKRAQGLVQFVPSSSGKAFDILAAPGRAAGWTSRTYPWPQVRPGSGGIEPLLLPWGGIGNVRYEWNGTGFVRGGG
ncbi:MAG: hypothetical protein M3O50_11765 [Myxococcota bacterium]|nr:hypothetical protein [Myxococcota bacterium]